MYIWGLPTLPVETTRRTTDEQSRPAKRRRQEGELQFPTITVDNVAWEASSRRFLFIVDCKPLMQICCGHIPLLNEDLRPLCERLTGNLVGILEQGWRPPSEESYPVKWRRRCHNTVADLLCKHTMDMKQSWKRTWPPPPGGHHGRTNFLIFSDGGHRPGTSSASAWIICWAICRDGGASWQYSPMAAEGIFFAEPIGSFKAECIALESATLHFNKYTNLH